MRYCFERFLPKVIRVYAGEGRSDIKGNLLTHKGGQNKSDTNGVSGEHKKSDPKTTSLDKG